VLSLTPVLGVPVVAVGKLVFGRLIKWGGIKSRSRSQGGSGWGEMKSISTLLSMRREFP